VENKRREILRSLPLDHPEYRRAKFLGILSPLKMEDVKRSSYWYKKWGIKPPRKERVKATSIPFKIPNSPPLCGEDWLSEHLDDHTPEEIEALSIEITCDDRQLRPVSVSNKRGTVKTMVRRLR